MRRILSHVYSPTAIGLGRQFSRFEDMQGLAVRIVFDESHAPGEHLVHMPLRVRGSVPVPRDLTVPDAPVEPN